MRHLISLILISILCAGCKTYYQFFDWDTPLHDSMRGATRLRVRTGGVCHRFFDDEKTLLDINDPQEVAKLIDRIRVGVGFGSCLCCGGPTMEFYRQDQLVASLAIQHGRKLRWHEGFWSGDAPLIFDSSEFLLKWLAERGVDGPMKEVETTASISREDAIAEDRWRAAMPESLKPFWSVTMGGPYDWGSQKSEWQAALNRQIKDEKPRILALLEWYGSGKGPWSGFPSYETVAEDLLLLHQTNSILKSIDNSELTDRQIEGAARLFAGFKFFQERPEDLRLLPASLKQQLLEHSLKSDDEDKKSRAKSAFETKSP